MPPFLNSISENIEGKEDYRTIYSMSKNSGINDTFIEAMVNKVINAITDKLEELDISLDYIAAALIDNASAQDIATRQDHRGRMREDKRNLDDQD